MKRIFITGGRGEIGQAIINVFSENQYEIISPTSQELDCSNNESISNYFKNFNGESINAFVHCAGINNPKSFLEVTPDTIFKTIQINTLSFLYLIQKLNPYFINEMSRVVAVSSIYGNISRSKRIEYATSKHGLKGMIQTLALELAERTILVNSVSPGFIATKLTYKNNSAETIANLLADVPLKKLGKPEYIAELIYFLCSEKNNFITGQDIIIDGGYLAGGFQP
ncbi:MAG TPA: SDR family oxidoreductase [Cyclobacteriaceae bacterium]